MKIVCNCGHTDTLDKFITTGEPYKKRIQLSDGQEEVHLVYDKTFKCPKCGAYEKETVLQSVVDENGSASEEDED